MSWYALQVIGGRRAMESVKQAAMDVGFFARIPTCTITQRPIFGEYVFVQFDERFAGALSEQAIGKRLALIRVMPKADAAIARIAGHVTASEMLTIDAIERHVAADAVPAELHGVEHGDVIEITKGPMAGQRATFVRGLRRGSLPRGRWMLVVELTILGRALVMELAPDSARRVRQAASTRQRR